MKNMEGKRMGLFKKERIYYSGVVGDIVRIPCKVNTRNIIANGTEKEFKILTALMGPKKQRNKTGIWNMDYFGFTNMKDASDVKYHDGYTATYAGNNTYNVKENVNRGSDFIAMKIVVGCAPEIAENPKSNVNKWIHAVSKPTRGKMWWIVGLLTSIVGVGLIMLGDAIYRLHLNSVKKSCLKKAKKEYKKNGNQVVVF